MAAMEAFIDGSTVDTGLNDDPHSSKYVRLNDGSRRRSTTGHSSIHEESRSSKKTDSAVDGKNKKETDRNTIAQDAHLRHYQEHLEERRLKNKRLREGKMVTLLRKKPAVVEKRDVACQVTPADLGLDDWEDDDEDEEEEEEYDYGVPTSASRPASAAPGPGPWQDVSTPSFNAEAYQQWYGQHWLGQNEAIGQDYAYQQPNENSEAVTQLTQEQTYRYVYYYYNYYAAMEADDGAMDESRDNYSRFGGYAPNQFGDGTNASQPGPWQDTGNSANADNGSKRHMRDLFDEWRKKYEEWYRATFGKDVRDSQREEDVTIMAHRAQLEAARLAALREEQEHHLERPGRPDSLLPAPPLNQESMLAAAAGIESSESLLPPPPPSAPPPETPPPPPETPRPETPAAQKAAAAAAAHVLGANMATAADVAAAIARLSNSDLTAILSSVNRNTMADQRDSSSPASSTSTNTVTSEANASTTITHPSPTLYRLPPLPVIGLPNPVATPLFPPPSPIAIRRDGLNATATILPAPTAAATLFAATQLVIALPPRLPASLAPPSLPSGLPSIPQMMLLQPSMKFGPPFKPFGVFQGSTEDKWGPDCPLGRYGQRKEEEEKERKLRLEVKKKQMNEQTAASVNGEETLTNGSVSQASQKSDENSTKSDGRESPEPKESISKSDDEKEKEDNEEKKEGSDKNSNDGAEIDSDNDDAASVSSGDSMCSTATQSVAIGPRRPRLAPSVAGGMGAAPGFKPSRMLLANAVNTSSIPVEKLTSINESAAKRAVSDGKWYAPSQPLNSLRLPKQAMIHTLQTHLKPKVSDLQSREKDPKLQLKLSYAKYLIDTIRELLDMPVKFVVGSLNRLPTKRAQLFYGNDVEKIVSSIKLCDVYVGDVFIAQGIAGSALGAKDAAARQAFKVLSRPGYILGSTRLWQETDHLVLCISEFPLTVPILPPFLLDPCSSVIVNGPQPPSEFGPLGPGGDGVDGNEEGELGWEMEDEEDWLLQSVAINPKPLENLWLYENFDEVAVANALRQVEERRKERIQRQNDRRKRRESGEECEQQNVDAETESSKNLVNSRNRRRSSLHQTSFAPTGDDVHESALADMAALSLTKEDEECLEETVQVDEADLSRVVMDPEALSILTRSCDFSHMMLSIEVEVNRDATFTCCVFIDRQFCADAVDQPTVDQARNLAASRALALLRLSQPAVGLDAPEVSEEAVVDSIMWSTRGQTVRPVIPLMLSYDMQRLEWDRLFRFYAESATIEPFFISQKELSRSEWPNVKKEAEKWGLLVKESEVKMPQEPDEENTLSLFVCKRMPLTTVKQKLIRQGRCGHFLLLRRGVYPTSEDEEPFVSDDEEEEEETANHDESTFTANEADFMPVIAVDIKDEPMEEEEPVDDLIFLGGAVTSNECEIIDDLPKTRIPGFDY